MKFESGCLAVADPAAGDQVCESVAALTEWYNARLEESVSLAVEQYWWLHRRWREPPAKIAKRFEQQIEAREAGGLRRRVRDVTRLPCQPPERPAALGERPAALGERL